MKPSGNLLHQLSLLFSSFSFSADFLPSICSSLSHPQNKNQPTHHSMSLSSYSPLFRGQASEKIGLYIPVPNSTFLTYSSPHPNLPTMSLGTLLILVTSSLFVGSFRFLNLALGHLLKMFYSMTVQSDTTLDFLLLLDHSSSVS